MMTPNEKKELEVLRELRHWFAAHIDLHEWLEGKPTYVCLVSIEKSIWLEGQELLDASYVASNQTQAR